MRPIAALLCPLLPIALGCTSIPGRFTRGDPSVERRWGFVVLEERPDSLALEIVVLDYSAVCTAADGQMERAKEVFLRAAREVALERGRSIGEIGPVDLHASHVRNTWDGVCTSRASGRVPLTGEAGAEDLAWWAREKERRREAAASPVDAWPTVHPGLEPPPWDSAATSSPRG